MKGLLFILCISAVGRPALAKDNLAEDLLAIVNMKPAEVTQQKVSAVFGQPTETEAGKKELVWHYVTDNARLNIYWREKDSTMEKFSFVYTQVDEKRQFDNALAVKLKLGKTVLADAVQVFGVPKDMTIKHMNQELHYKYKGNMLNLFFRKGMLVNYTLY
jgi:hypothetical protein